MNSRSPLDPETRGDARDEERRARTLAEYHQWLVAGLTLDSPHDGGASNDDLSQAQDCLELIERVRRREAQTPPAVSKQARPTEPPEGLSQAEVRRIGRFEIVRRLGGGGYGVVFLAHDPRLNRPVALKVPAPDVLLHSELKRRFLRESEAAAVLQHPHIVTVYEAGQVGPICYMASRYCPGPTLSDWLRKRATPVPSADGYMLVQDDALFSDLPGVRQHLERVFWPGERPGIASLFCSRAYTLPRAGWHQFTGTWRWCALAFVFSRAAAQRFLADMEVVRHRWSRHRNGLADISWRIGKWARSAGVPVYYPTPSIVQHIGDVSTLWQGARIFGNRRASWFASMMSASVRSK